MPSKTGDASESKRSAGKEGPEHQCWLPTHSKLIVNLANASQHAHSEPARVFCGATAAEAPLLALIVAVDTE
jgi:hypothetical protein